VLAVPNVALSSWTSRGVSVAVTARAMLLAERDLGPSAETSGTKMLARTLIVISTLLVEVLQGLPARAQEAKAGDLVISQAWSRATPGGAKVASGYLTIENRGSAPDRLLGGFADVATKVEVHEMATANGVMTMRLAEGGLPIPVGTTVKLAPSAFHLMLADLKRPLKQGDHLQITLNFEKAGKIAATFDVLGIGAKGPEESSKAPATDHGKMKM
jgi:copper(I)-binding protein